MAQGQALICRLLASSVSVAHKAGKIIRDVMQKGDLGIIDKVNTSIYINFLCYLL
jgi:3'(2'), 5'-bisphosphate nucleotidase